MGQVYVINGHLEETRDGYWTAGVFTDKEKADRVCAWLNSLSKLNGELFAKEMDSWSDEEGSPKKPRAKEIEYMEEIIGSQGWYEVVTEQVFETAAQWMGAHSELDKDNMADWPDVHALEVGLDTHDAHCDEAKEAKQLRLF